MKKIICILLCLVMLLALASCGDKCQPNDIPTTQTPTPESPTTETLPTEPPTTEPEPEWITFPEDRELTAKQYFVYDCETAEFLTISGKQDEKIYPASITKLFTAYVALQYLKADTSITVKNELDLVHAGSSVAELKKGDELTVRLLIEAMMLPSGNDAAYVLAVAAGRVIAGNSATPQKAADAFVKAMNAQAVALGMGNTHFANPDGIHKDDHYSTFADLALMGTLVQEDPVLMTYVATTQDTITLASGEKQWKNTNELIHPESQYYCPYAIGLKTGQTPSAGSCLLSAFEYKGRTLVVGVFGCPDIEARFADTLQLFNDTIGYTG